MRVEIPLRRAFVLFLPSVVFGDVRRMPETGAVGGVPIKGTSPVTTTLHTLRTFQTLSLQRNLDQKSEGNGCLNHDQSNYRGTISVTKSGRPCQAWDVQFPHVHTRTPQSFPDSGLASNYCRNPDNSPKAWCYTTDPFKRWEWCDIPMCPNEWSAPENSALPTSQPTGSTVVEDEDIDQYSSIFPTVRPSSQQTNFPSAVLTVSPSQLPTDKPEIAISPAPITTEPSPTDAPAESTNQVTIEPSSSIKTQSPTGPVEERSPTHAPTKALTKSPFTMAATKSPTITPIAMNPTTMPTTAPENGSDMGMPTNAPSSNKDAANHVVGSSFVREGISMNLRGVMSIGEGSQEIFTEIYQEHVKGYYQDKGREVEVSISVTKIHLPADTNRRRRGFRIRSLAEGAKKGVKITFTQESRLVSPEPLPEDSIDKFIEEPFEKKPERDMFAKELREANDEFSELTSVSPIELPTYSSPNTSEPTTAPTIPRPTSIPMRGPATSPSMVDGTRVPTSIEWSTGAPTSRPTIASWTDQGNSIGAMQEETDEPTDRKKVGAVIAVAVVIVGVSIVLVLGYYLYLKRKDQSVGANLSKCTESERPEFEENPRHERSHLSDSDISISEVDEDASITPSQWQLSVVCDGDDGISTIAGSVRDIQSGMSRSSSRFLGGDDQSCLTEEDFDYPNPYLPNQTSTPMSLPRAALPPMDSDDSSTTQSEGEVSYAQLLLTTTGSEGKVADVVIIDAPPGRLGIIIQADINNGPPVVHSVKGSSPLIGQIKMGDMLVAVDECDISRMNAIQATKEIADRTNQQRRIHVLRARS